MRAASDLSELERELELYLGREFETGQSITIRVLNTENADTTIMFRDDGGAKVTVAITPGMTFQMTGVWRKKGGTVVAGQVKDLPKNGDPYTGELRMWVQEKQMQVGPPGVGSYTHVRTYRYHAGQEEATRTTLLGFIRGLAIKEYELDEGGDDEAGDHEWELEDEDEELEADEEASALDEDEELETADEADELDARELDAMEDASVAERYARRMHEVSVREFESEADLDAELEQGLDAMAEEYFVKRLRRKRRRGKGKGGLFGKILKTGAKIVGKIASKTPVGSLIKAGTSLVRGDVKGALGNLAKAAVGTALGPVAGTVATTAIDALGGEEGELGIRRRRAIRKVARISRDTYRELADTLPEDFDHPLVASEVVRRAVRRSMIRNGVQPPRRRRALRRRRLHGPRRVIRVRPDEEIVLVGGR